MMPLAMAYKTSTLRPSLIALFVVSTALAACSGESAVSPHNGSGGGGGGLNGAGGVGAGGQSPGGMIGTGSGGQSLGGMIGTGSGGHGAGGTMSPDAAIDGDAGDAPQDQVIDQTVDQTIDQTPRSPNGAACTTGATCQSGNCVDNLCCDQPCTDACYTCSATPGTCLAAAKGTNPHQACATMAQSTCGTTGVCDGVGACQKFAAGLVCSGFPSCDTSTGLVTGQVCDGTGNCATGTAVDCRGFVCMPPNQSCKTSCASDADCLSTHICSAGTCVPRAGNLAGNGDLEYGTTAGWYGTFGGGGTLSVSDTTAAGFAHTGRYGGTCFGRTAAYHGPAYRLPTGAGKYVVSAWGMQNSEGSLNGMLSIQFQCATVNPVTAGASVTLPMKQGVWTQFTTTFDTTATATTSPLGDCLPAMGGVVKLARLVFNSDAGSSGTPPDLFVDDVVVQVADGHNLVANPGFDSPFITDGWSTGGAAAPAALSISSTQFKSGTASLSMTGRPLPTSGPTYALPIGALRYNVSVQALHTGTSTHSLVLQPTYTCLGGVATTASPIATVAAAPGGTWTPLAGTVTLPPADAPPGCRLTAATVSVRQSETGTCTASGGALEGPDLYIDDVSITLAP